jgi:hypothetical protein
LVGGIGGARLSVSILHEFHPGRLIGEYIEPGPRDAEETLARLIALLDSQDLGSRKSRVADREVTGLGSIQGLIRAWLKAKR